MTKEELEKDYYADRPTEPYSDADSPNDWANIAHYAEESLEKAFERIVELEATNKKISDECHKLVDSFERMQKENAELKLKLNALEGQTPWKDIKDKSELIGKLTEAKGLLKWWVNPCGDHDLFYAEKTEQFLSEVEK